MRIKWLRKADKNLDEIVNYIARDDPEMARKIYACLRKSVAGLVSHPEMERPGRVLGTRELVIKRYPYIIPYRVRGQEIQILRVFHTSQKLPEVW